MKILIVSYFYPPFNTIGAVRVGKLSKYLQKMGNDVRVLTAANQPLPDTLPVEIPEDNIVRTNWLNINYLPELVVGGREKVRREGFTTSRTSGYFKKLGKLYKTLTNFPDAQIGWYLSALGSGKKIIAEWRPDVIYASAMPYTSLLVAAKLANIGNVPWVAELRDLWVDNPYYEFGYIRRKIEDKLERSVLSQAKGLITVSEPLADVLRNKYNKPVLSLPNGYDPADFDFKVSAEPRKGTDILLAYTGMIYEGKRDPSVLFCAAGKVCKFSQCRIKFAFYGRYLEVVKELARKYRIEQLVEVHPAVPYRESLRIQKSADVLLLLLWDDPAEKGVYTGKLFEYIGAGKPILVVGSKDSVAAQLVAGHNFGRVVNTCDEAERAIEDILSGKYIYAGDPEVRSKYTRERLAAELDRFLRELVD